MEKSPDAFRTISEAAEELDLPQHVLRFWETRFSHIRPLKRGGGRRYYRPDDVLLLKGIKHLLYGQGFTIKGVQRILKEQGIRQVISIGETGAVSDDLSDQFDDADAVELLTLPEGSGEGEQRLTVQDRNRLTEVMRDLLDLKRSLDRAREGH